MPHIVHLTTMRSLCHVSIVLDQHCIGKAPINSDSTPSSTFRASTPAWPRAGEECPETLRPLVELMYRGVLRHHGNGRDWSVRAFLTRPASTSPAGPGLEVANDADTRAARLRAIIELAQTHVDELRGRRLDANDFSRLIGVNLNRDLLWWMGDATATREGMDKNRSESFRDEVARSNPGPLDHATGAETAYNARYGR